MISMALCILDFPVQETDPEQHSEIIYYFTDISTANGRRLVGTK